MILELCRDASRELGLRAPLCDGGRNTRRVTTHGPGAPSCVTALAQVPAVAKITGVTFNRDNEVPKKKKKTKKKKSRRGIAQQHSDWMVLLYSAAFSLSLSKKRHYVSSYFLKIPLKIYITLYKYCPSHKCIRIYRIHKDVH
jgi:hypothetical protein